MKPPANWYNDPSDPSFKRYWDGERWTNNYYNPVTKEQFRKETASAPVREETEGEVATQEQKPYRGRRVAVSQDEALASEEEPKQMVNFPLKGEQNSATPHGSSRDHSSLQSEAAVATSVNSDSSYIRVELLPPVELDASAGFSFTGRKEISRLQAALEVVNKENELLRNAFAAARLLTPVELEQQRRELDDARLAMEQQIASTREAMASEAAHAKAELQRCEQELHERVKTIEADEAEARNRLSQLQSQIAIGDETLMLQTVGYYNFNHPLEDALAYKDELKRLTDKIKTSVRNKTAIDASNTWTVNGSARQGQTMVNQISRLMLRAYNNEAEQLIRTMKPYKLEASIDKLNKSVELIAKTGQAMAISIAPAYHALRVQELRLTADYLEMRELEKERERELREQAREEEKVQREMQKKKEALDKEERQKTLALEQLRIRLHATQDIAAQEEVKASMAALLVEIEEIAEAKDDVEKRAANSKAGFVYVISNLGAFGDRMVKIGMTRRADPMDRVNELGDASVPFRFDVHLLHYSEDAVGIETSLHRHFEARKVNLINGRKEFFYATPLEVEAALRDLGLAGSITAFNEDFVADQFRQSETIRRSN